MVATSDSAECTALRSSTMPIAPSSATGPRIQNATASPVLTWFGPCRRPAPPESRSCVVPSDLDGRAD